MPLSRSDTGILARRDQLFHVLADQVDFDVDRGSQVVGAHDGGLVGVGNDRNPDHIAVESSDSKADAIERDRAFVDDVAVEFGGDANSEPPVSVGQRIECEEFGGTVHVALDDMAAQAIAEGRRPFQIHERILAEYAEVGARERFRRKIAPEAVGLDIDGRQTDAVYRDARTILYVFQDEAAPDAHAMTRGCDGADFFNDPGEHACPSFDNVRFDCELVGRDGVETDIVQLDRVGAAQSAGAAGDRKRL